MTTATPKSLDPDRSGVYLAPAAVYPLRHAAAQARLVWFDLDLGHCGDKARFLARCSQQLDFPQSFGANWDALADCLQDFSWRPAAGYILNIRHAAGFARAAPEDFATVLEILETAATFWKQRGKVFIVLVDDVADLPVLTS